MPTLLLLFYPFNGEWELTTGEKPTYNPQDLSGKWNEKSKA